MRYAALWGFEALEAFELTGGFSNTSFRVVTRDRGELVVRRYERLHVTRNAVAHEHAVMRYAAERSACVRAPLADAAGETLRPIDGAFVALLPYLSGTTGARDARAAAASAELLVAFHRATIGFRATRPRRARTLATLAWLRERFVGFAADPALANALDWRTAIAVVGSASARIASLASALPIGVVHADVHPDNVVSRAGRARALIDFDFVHETERAYDLATAADAYARADEASALDAERFFGYVRAYDALAPLTRDEWNALFDLAIRRAAMLVWYIVTRHGKRVRGDVGASARYVARLGELEGYAASKIARDA